MFKLRVLRNLILVITLYALLWLPIRWFDGYLDSPLGFVLLFPLISVYLFDKAGVPGLLDNGGLCGWGWCAPSVFGWTFLAVFWLGLLWLIVALFTRKRR